MGVKNNEKKLNPKQLLFCQYYMKNRNATLAYVKAYGCKYDFAYKNAYKMMVKDGIKKELARLKKEKLKSIALDKNDIVERYMNIAFADMTDFVEWGKTDKRNYVNFKSSEYIDGGLVCEVKQGREGISLKLEDRQKALDWLANFFEMNPMNKHKKKFDNKKLELEEKRIDNEINTDLKPIVIIDSNEKYEEWKKNNAGS
jgi:phage terminase small subunit